MIYAVDYARFIVKYDREMRCVLCQTPPVPLALLASPHAEQRIDAEYYNEQTDTACGLQNME